MIISGDRYAGHKDAVLDTRKVSKCASPKNLRKNKSWNSTLQESS